MNNKILFCNTGWMNLYNGDVNSLKGGGSFPKKKGWGYEIFNFENFKGKVYGHVEPRGGKTINIERIGVSNYSNKIENVLVVWTASHPLRKATCIVGWYKDATVYRNTQSPPKGYNRSFSDEEIGFFVSAKSVNSKLLGLDERKFIVPRGKNFFGESNVWYAEHVSDFVKGVQKYISGRKISLIPKPPLSSAWQTNPLIRIQVEKKAVETVTNYYKKLGYGVQSYEKDNLGWDLVAKDDKVELKLEVKGLSGNIILAELTPNELEKLNADKIFYRLCIVTQALSKKPILKIFSYSSTVDNWVSDDGIVIKFKKIISARIYV